MVQVSYFSQADRQSAKQASRARDEGDLRDGRVSQADLRAANGVFSSLDLSASSIRRRGVFGG